MDAKDRSTRKSSNAATPNRRQFLQIAGVSVAGAAVAGPVLAACKSSSSGGGGGGGKSLKIGFVSPRTGPAAGFGEPDGYVLTLARKAFASGLTVGGTKYDVTIIDKDSQSNPQRSAQVANDLINGSNVDLLLTTSTPETVNPVSDAARQPASRASRRLCPGRPGTSAGAPSRASPRRSSSPTTSASAWSSSTTPTRTCGRR